MARKAKVLPPYGQHKTKPKTVQERPLVAGEECAVMYVPNHRTPLLAHKDCPWPIMNMLTENTVGQFVAAFLCELHSPEYNWHWSEHPPSWMDPVWFMHMAQKDEAVCALLNKALRKNSKEVVLKPLKKELARVFEEQYLPAMMHKFDELTENLADWLVCHVGAMVADENLKKSNEKYYAGLRDRAV